MKQQLYEYASKRTFPSFPFSDLEGQRSFKPALEHTNKKLGSDHEKYTFIRLKGEKDPINPISR
ncbi:hypothetical protein [Shouchella clausii]|uniref:hypothetical protein n=1 Tax=Shouchella clausii TaxID=79880 RepID=UPI000BA65975|nr:hypothetical protein [Shouchella clausii]PAD19118.1 hypothetical protein CHH73_03385 [Shouchella clausii]